MSCATISSVMKKVSMGTYADHLACLFKVELPVGTQNYVCKHDLNLSPFDDKHFLHSLVHGLFKIEDLARVNGCRLLASHFWPDEIL